MKQLNLIFILATILLFSKIALSQEIPFFGLGPSLGWENGTLDNVDISGPTMELRLAAIFRTSPMLLALGYDGTYSRLALESGPANEITGDRYSHGPMIGTMIPLSWFGIGGLPKGFGLPLFLNYKIEDRIDFLSGNGSLVGKGWKAGIQLPIKSVVLQAAYNKTTFDENRGASFLSAGDKDIETWMFTLQIPIVFFYH